jgi:hypothetical protein
MSLDTIDWYEVASGSLPDVRGLDCHDNKLVKFTFEAVAYGRYLSFNALTYFGSGPGLQCIVFE